MSGHEKGYPDWQRIWSYRRPDDATEGSPPVNDIHAGGELIDDAKEAPAMGKQTENLGYPVKNAAYTKAELIDQLLAMGVAGRHCKFYASLKALGPVEGGGQTFVEASYGGASAISGGLVLFPTFSFSDFTELGYWDRQNTPSRMGWITELARRDPRFVRTSHPILSFAIGGEGVKESGYLADVQNGHGAGSVFARLVENDGLLLSFSGKGFRPNDTGYTTSNHCAVLAGAPWRYMKVFEGTYVDKGVATIRRYSASVCLRDRYVTEVTPAHGAAEREGIIKRYPLGGTECLVASAREFVEWGVQAHKERPELWRRIL